MDLAKPEGLLLEKVKTVLNPSSGSHGIYIPINLHPSQFQLQEPHIGLDRPVVTALVSPPLPNQQLRR